MSVSEMRINTFDYNYFQQIIPDNEDEYRNLH